MGARFGRYETLGVLGGGGMATVYVARALAAGGFERLVALKVMHAHLAMNAEFVAMFLDEARLAAKIRHPNVAATLDLCQDASGAYLVMEYIEGPSLEELVAAQRPSGDPLPLGIALRILLDLLAGLHAAHELRDTEGGPLGLVHRDVSPHNVMVGIDGVARITDFGVAFAAARLTVTKFGHIKGKIAYAAPEQVMLDTLDRRADVYAAGVVAWELLSGRRLFDGEDDLSVGARVVAGVSESPRAHRPELPDSLAEAVMRALTGERDARFPTTLAFAEALEAAAESSGTRVASPRALASYVIERAVHRPAPAEIGTDPGMHALVAGDPGMTSPPSARARRWPLVVGMVLALSSLGVIVASRGGRAAPSVDGSSSPVLAATPPSAAPSGEAPIEITPVVGPVASVAPAPTPARSAEARPPRTPPQATSPPPPSAKPTATTRGFRPTEL